MTEPERTPVQSALLAAASDLKSRVAWYEANIAKAQQSIQNHQRTIDKMLEMKAANEVAIDELRAQYIKTTKGE